MTDISTEERTFTVDDVMEWEARSTDNTEDDTEDVEVKDHPKYLIDQGFEATATALLECKQDIERLVAQRLDINATIKVRRDQLNKLERMARIASEAATLDDEPSGETDQSE